MRAHSADVLAIVQAHMGSKRLPGKVLMDIAGQPMLARVIQRVRACPVVTRVAVATTTLEQDDAIVKMCSDLGVPVFRGSEGDVLDRFTQAARAFDGEVLVRITSDCPLIDPEVSAAIIRKFRAAAPPVDYASNKIPQSYPRGLDTEVFTQAALEMTWAAAQAEYERAHVTIYMYEHPHDFRLLSVTDTVDRSDWRWTVDTQEDLDFVRTVYERLGPQAHFTWRQVIALVESDPGLPAINRHVLQKDVRLG